MVNVVLAHTLPRPTIIIAHRMNPINFKVADGKLKGIHLVSFESTLVRSSCLKSTLGFKELSKHLNWNFENG